MRKYKYLILTLTLLTTHFIHAQDFNVGLKYGIGKTGYTRSSDSKKLSDETTQSYGLRLEFAPYLSRFFIISGADFETSTYGNYLTVPLDLRISLGNVVSPFVEGGAYYTLILADESEIYDQSNHFGARAGVGLLWNINKRLRLEGGYFGLFGLTTALEEEIPLPANQFQTEEYKLKGYKLEFSFKYRF